MHALVNDVGDHIAKPQQYAGSENLRANVPMYAQTIYMMITVFIYITVVVGRSDYSNAREASMCDT